MGWLTTYVSRTYYNIHSMALKRNTQINLASIFGSSRSKNIKRNNANAVTEEEFKAGFQYLSGLSGEEYHKSLSDCISDGLRSPF